MPLPDVAASFAEAVGDVLTAKTIAACRAHGVDTLRGRRRVLRQLPAAGLAAKRCAEAGIDAAHPAHPLLHRQRRDDRRARLGRGARGLPPSSLDLPVDSSMPLTQVLA